ncbi:sulfotransferase domain-containing protein [uncultured Eudoraea sp.]|uniref:sulfotransferase domain-containing protein n=1 Tax=uncultured Eudoraea sp. TaxID=1035614 RepID=UPI0026081C64|nr:sulfotransferase domain-containing protein [uncultured Eudoraea sp.]
MATYSATDKFLHKFYLSNYSISKATLEMEELLYSQKAKQLEVKQYVFVTGLARSGTTAVMNKIFETGLYASLQYANMPFLLSPNLWKRKSKIESHERAHKDGIIIDGNSPEEFDEYFWKVFMNDSYIMSDGLALHEAGEEVLEKYLKYISLICLAKGKDKYISKNNNNVLRLSTLNKIDHSKIILLFRDPLSHASSLMKLDRRFSKNQTEDPFTLEYFNYLGHHEFGLNHKPFLLTSDFDANRELYTKESLNYWLSVWLNYYSYILQNMEDDYMFVGFEDLIKNPDMVYSYLADCLSLEIEFEESKKHNPTTYEVLNYDRELLNQCIKVYDSLTELKKY